MRAYEVTLAPSSHTTEENAKLPLLKQRYEDSLFERILLLEPDLQIMIGAGRVVECKLLGTIMKLKDLK